MIWSPGDGARHLLHTTVIDIDPYPYPYMGNFVKHFVVTYLFRFCQNPVGVAGNRRLNFAANFR